VPKAVVVLKPGAMLADPNALVDCCSERLAHYECPGVVSQTSRLSSSTRLGVSAKGCAGRARRASAALSSAGLLAARVLARIHL